MRIRLPVKCPVCGVTRATAFTHCDVKLAVRGGSPLRLYACCHLQFWDASADELRSIREHLAARSANPPRQRHQVSKIRVPMV